MPKAFTHSARVARRSRFDELTNSKLSPSRPESLLGLLPEVQYFAGRLSRLCSLFGFG